MSEVQNFWTPHTMVNGWLKIMSTNPTAVVLESPDLTWDDATTICRAHNRVQQRRGWVMGEVQKPNAFLTRVRDVVSKRWSGTYPKGDDLEKAAAFLAETADEALEVIQAAMAFIDAQQTGYIKESSALDYALGRWEDTAARVLKSLQNREGG